MPFGLETAAIAPTVLYATGIGCFAASVQRRPHVGLYYLVPLLPLQTARYWLHQFPLGAQWIDVMLLGIAIGIWRQGYSAFVSARVTRGLVGFAIFTYLSLWQGAIYLGSSLPLWFTNERLSYWKNYMVMFLVFFFVAAAVRTTTQMKRLLLIMCLSVVILNRSYINTSRGRDYSHFSYGVRDAGAMGYAGVNGIAAFEAEFAVFLLGLYSGGKRSPARYAILPLVGVCAYALMFTLSRGGYLAFLVGALAIGVLQNRKLIILLALFLFSWQAFVPTAVQERVFMTEGADGQLESSAADRVVLWDSALAIFKQDPVLGVGFDTYRHLGLVGDYRDTHNIYVKVLLETGVVGLILFLRIFWSMIATGFTLFRESEPGGSFMRGLGLGLIGLTVAAGVANFFGDRWTYIEITGYAFAILGMVARCHWIRNEEEGSEEDAEEIPSTAELAVCQ